MCNLLIPRYLSIALTLFILVTACKQRDQQPPDTDNPSLDQPTGSQDLRIFEETEPANQADKSGSITKTPTRNQETPNHDSKETLSSSIQKLKKKTKEIFSSPKQDTPLTEEQAEKAKKKEEKKVLEARKKEEKKKKKKEEERLRKEEEARKQEEERKKKEEEKRKKKEQEARKKEEKKKKKKEEERKKKEEKRKKKEQEAREKEEKKKEEGKKKKKEDN